ncbi:28S ribosomal protein S11, mitochondrial [Trichinella nelsoni]|uniref:28S ribosomal protein S11, mitochondrial n=1 Tax=Trichinella nelsoni TaxID=6336 RepID=A0A0V0SJ37_9BILA|nr:28S ribosomal protein S11, mitochondrial [Trichinella nelsoni]
MEKNSHYHESELSSQTVPHFYAFSVVQKYSDLMLFSALKNFSSSVTLLAPVTRCLSLSSTLLGRMDRREHLIGSSKVEEGVEGEKYYETAQTEASGNFPTYETFKQLFYGIPFEDTPICYVKCSKNNTKITFTDSVGRFQVMTTCGLEGFKNCKKKTEVAGQSTGIAAGLKALRRGITSARVVLKGLGPGRSSSIKGMALSGLKIISITDDTPLPELGPRPRKQRKV